MGKKVTYGFRLRCEVRKKDPVSNCFENKVAGLELTHVLDSVVRHFDGLEPLRRWSRNWRRASSVVVKKLVEENSGRVSGICVGFAPCAASADLVIWRVHAIPNRDNSGPGQSRHLFSFCKDINPRERAVLEVSYRPSFLS